MWKRIINESNDEECITIHTGLSGKIAKDILASVIGQLSDGLWENSPMSEHYWRFADIDTEGNEAVIKVQTREYYSQTVVFNGSKHYIDNYFMTKMNGDEGKIKEFFATKIKAIAKEELKDNGMKDGWDRTNLEESDYLSYDTPVTFGDIYFVYETLKGRHNSSRYPEDVLRDFGEA